MDFYSALEDFSASLKAMKVAEIACVGASDADADAARLAWSKAKQGAQETGLRLLEAPARSPADLVMKAKALRLRCPDVSIEQRSLSGVGDSASEEQRFALTAMRYIVRDLMALAS